MKQYYYTDPLAAAWMSKHFGLAITAPYWRLDGDYYDNGEPLSVIGWGEKVVQAMAEEDFIPERLYLHPESLPLLEPTEKDLIFAADRLHLPGQFDAGEIGCGTYRIIQRDGKPFHHPESEEA